MIIRIVFKRYPVSREHIVVKGRTFSFWEKLELLDLVPLRFGPGDVDEKNTRDNEARQAEQRGDGGAR
jgi:hypothetical protein